MEQLKDDNLSDEEIFFGKLSIKEIKKHVAIDRYRHSVTCTDTKLENSDSDNSLKIIETCSEPDHKSEASLNVSDFNASLLNEHKRVSNWDTDSVNDSFLQMEKMVSELKISPNNNKEELDNTLDVVEYILNNAPTLEERHKVEKLEYLNSENLKVKTITTFQVNIIEPQNLNILLDPKTEKYSVEGIRNVELLNQSVKADGCKKWTPVPTQVINSAKTVDELQKTDILFTPNNKKNTKVPFFKTPKSPTSLKKQFITPRKTLSKLNSYQHISSPVATYIKNGPQVPLLKDIRPKKPLAGMSSIPKLQKSTERKSNKENITLPSVAYKSAKNMKVIKVPDEDKLPESQWAKKLSSSLPKPVVIKHDHRENNMSKKILEPQADNSFANLTLHQAEISVCTQKTAFNNIKKKYV